MVANCLFKVIKMLNETMGADKIILFREQWIVVSKVVEIDGPRNIVFLEELTNCFYSDFTNVNSIDGQVWPQFVIATKNRSRGSSKLYDLASIGQ